MNWIGYTLKYHGKINLKYVFFIVVSFAALSFINVSLVHASSTDGIHDDMTGDPAKKECSICHFPEVASRTMTGSKIEDAKETAYSSNYVSASSTQGNYSAILAVGQTPFQLGPFYRDGITGWSWWDTDDFGTEKQKNLIELMILDNTRGTIKPVTGLASRPAWPQASYRKHSGNYSFKADTASSPITTLTGYPNQADIWMIKEVNLGGYSKANLTFQTWYSMETDWDYGYVAVSINGIWTNLPGTLTTTANPNGTNLGNGITGTTNGLWKQETMNLTPYAGEKIFLGFRFKSDEEVNDEGWYVDDISVTSGMNTIFNDDAETPAVIRNLSVNVTYPQLTLLNIADPLTGATVLQYAESTRQVNVQEDLNHPGTYTGYFLYDPFAEQYSGNYYVTFDTIINGSQVTAGTQFQTTVFGCQSCHNKKDSGAETSFIHGESGYYGGYESCMFMCHSGSRGFYGGSPPFMGPPNSSNPMHVHEMQYGHRGGFLPGIFYPQPRYDRKAHVNTTTCLQCHTNFLHDNTGTDTATIGNYTLYGTNISFSKGLHENLTCEYCHGSLDYPEIPSSYQSEGRLGNHSPVFTSHESFTDTYIIAVDGTDDLNITVAGENTNGSIEVSTAGPVDNTTAGLQGPCGGELCNIIQGLEIPIHMNITHPYTGTWIVNLIQLQEGAINYTISSNYPIQEKPIIRIPECNNCHNPGGSGKAITDDLIPDWNPGFAHVDSDLDGMPDVQCRMCHDQMHDINIKKCQVCHAGAPDSHPIIDPSFSYYTWEQCLSCHGDPHIVSDIPDIGYINGTVKDNYGSAVSGATVSTGTGISTMSDVNGSYGLTFAPGTYQLTTTRGLEYYANNSVSVVVTAFNTTNLDIILTRKPTGNISGTVRNE